MWRLVLTVGWTGVFFAFAAVWKASEEIGLATWWLGPRSAPQPVVVRLLPFVLAIAVGAVVVANWHAAVWVSLAGSALIALLACFDITRSGGLALIEFAIAAAIALVTVAAFSGARRTGHGGRRGAPCRSPRPRRAASRPRWRS
jgi:hypothetical protein